MKKRDLLREYELLREEAEYDKSIIRKLSHENDELKKSLNGECVTGPQCNACQHGLERHGTFSTYFICLKTQLCKQFERKE